MKHEDIIINAKIGDGGIYSSGTNFRMQFQSKNLDWITFKRDLCVKAGFTARPIGMQKSGYTGKADVYKFETRVHETITAIANIPLESILQKLTKTQLIMWYLDDGSYHKIRYTMHLYCNMLTPEQVEILISRIEELYGSAPRPRVDRKKDGRAYPYIYLGRRIVEEFRKDVLRFIRQYHIDSMLYKAGEAQPLRETLNDYPTAYNKRQ